LLHVMDKFNQVLVTILPLHFMYWYRSTVTWHFSQNCTDEHNICFVKYTCTKANCYLLIWQSRMIFHEKKCLLDINLSEIAKLQNWFFSKENNMSTNGFILINENMVEHNTIACKTKIWTRDIEM
jgi:hypothetical protein